LKTDLKLIFKLNKTRFDFKYRIFENNFIVVESFGLGYCERVEKRGSYYCKHMRGENQNS
jgi:hypothetical protein